MYQYISNKSKNTYENKPICTNMYNIRYLQLKAAQKRFAV